MNERIPRFRETFARMLLAAGTQAPALRRSLWLMAASSVAQGLALACLYPLLTAALAGQPSAWSWLAAMAVCALADAGLRWWAHGFDYSPRLAGVTHELRVRLGECLRQMPMESLARGRAGEWSAVLAGNVDEVITPMGALTAIVLRSLIVPAVVVGATAWVDWRLALAMALLFPAALPLYRARRRAAARDTRALAAAHAQTSAELLEYVQGLPVLRAARCTGARADKLGTALQQLEQVQREAQLRGMAPGLGMASLVEVGLMVVLALGVWRVLGGALDVAALAAMLAVTVRFAEPLAMLAGMTAVFDYMESGLAQIEGLLAVRPLPQQQPAQVPQGAGVRFEQVSFRYAEPADSADADGGPGGGLGEAALREVDVHLPPRSLTALVGPSGAGKSTLVRLLLRHADPQQGCVRIGGADVRSLSPAALMQHVAVVFQDVHLFDDSVLANLRFGRPDASDAEVETAARAAGCHDFIMRLPQGYLTPLGEAGARLSGGERQRLSIARALLKNAPIVVLDEPTAALDSESERAVQHAIDALVAERTVLVIAHRLSTVMGADRILVLDGGRIVEQGRHAELLAARGRYAALWQAQMSHSRWRTG